MADARDLAIGLDTGGTFVDCVVALSDGTTVEAKAPTTPADLIVGVRDALANAARALDLSVEDLLARTSSLVHGTTVGLNSLISRQGRRVGLLTTVGHEDAILVGRVHQKIAGLSAEQIAHAAALDKPVPIVPRRLIRGIHERVDYAGREIVPLDEAGVLAAVDELVAAGIEALAIAFLWSFRSPDHELRARTISTGRHPDLPVTVSHESAPVLGEYERTATCVVNAYVGPTVTEYLHRLAKELADSGLPDPPYVVTSAGGIQPLDAVAARPAETLGSGPAGGMLAAQALGMELHEPNIVATDVGGTSFEVGLIVDGEPGLSSSPVFERLHLAVPAIDVRSIGAGGGSIAWIGPDGSLRVGPRSAGADPGPACYGRGGTEPTVTDADLLLGRLYPETLLGGRIALDRSAAERSVDAFATRLGTDRVGAAAAIVRVIDAQMADLVRDVMAERGHDPRRFVMTAYGGSAPLHAGSYAPDVGVSRVIVSPLAPVFSALGAARGDYRRVYVRSEAMVLPGDPTPLAEAVGALEAQARSDFAQTRLASDLRLARTVDLRFRRQTHQVAVPVADGQIDDREIAALCDRFLVEYERIFGHGTAYREAGIEASTVRVIASAPRAVPRPTAATRDTGDRDASAARSGERPVFFDVWVEETPVYDASRLRPGDCIDGPAVVDAPATTLVVHPGQVATVDPHRNIHLTFGAA